MILLSQVVLIGVGRSYTAEVCIAWVCRVHEGSAHLLSAFMGKAIRLGLVGLLSSPCHHGFSLRSP